MGCSPSLEIKPVNEDNPGNNFVAIKIHSRDMNCFYLGKTNFKYRCIECGSIINLIDYHGQAISVNQKFNCTSCQKSYQWQKINWRHKACISHFFIEIMGIFESEAIPSDNLLTQLEQFSKSKWNYFYAQTEMSL